MDCKIIKNLLSEYLEGDLDDLQKAQVEKHLSTCKDCAAEVESLKHLIKDLGSLKKVSAPEDLLDGIHRQLGIQPKKKPFIDRIKLPLEAAGVLVSIILIVIFINQPGILRKGKKAAGPAIEGAYESDKFMPEMSNRQGLSSGVLSFPQEADKDYSLKTEAPLKETTVITAKTKEDVAKVKSIVKELEGEVEKEEANNLYVKIPAKNAPILFDRLESANKESYSPVSTQDSVHFDIQFSDQQQ